MKSLLLLNIVLLSLLSYSLIGTEGNVSQIKKLAPAVLEANNLNVLRYEGYDRGSWGHHGGKVWYHCEEKGNPTLRYRMFLTLWNGEVHLTYGAPEVVQNTDIKVRIP
jgi:hypothetical protein